MKETVVKYGGYGLFAGFVVFIVHLVFGINNLEYTTNKILGYVSIVLSLSFVFFGIKHYRDHVNNGFISLGKAIAVGSLISLLVGLGIASADFIYTKFIDPSFFSNYEQTLIEQGKEHEIIKITSGTAALFMFVLVTVIGFFMSIISGLILQQNQ